MRFEVAAAFALGLLLPLLETCRRGLAHWSVNSTTMLEDYLAGLVLILAGLAATRGLAAAPQILLAAWAGVSTMMTISLLSQVEATIRAVDLEDRNGLVLGVKILLWATCAFALSRSFRLARVGAA